MKITAGDKFPNFSARTYDGQYISLGDLHGKHAVIYFYPKDDTPGCTLEAQEFSELISEFRRHNAEVIGVSVDSLESHKKFCNKYGIKISLISDIDKSLVQDLGIMRESGSAMRTTFVVDELGRIRKIYENVNPNGHAHEVLSYIKSSMEPALKKIVKPAKAVKKQRNVPKK